MGSLLSPSQMKRRPSDGAAGIHKKGGTVLGCKFNARDTITQRLCWFFGGARRRWTRETGVVVMSPAEGDKRFWESTRGRIILLLRGGSRTVSELAATLSLTESAVRTQLDRLARDGFVRSS